jgi:hypothetical protein
MRLLIIKPGGGFSLIGDIMVCYCEHWESNAAFELPEYSNETGAGTLCETHPKLSDNIRQMKYI